MAGKIFISYRRDGTAWAARALFERLWRTFPDQIFIDLEGIAPGAEFTEVIDSHLEGCHAMLAMIGPGWLEQIQDRLQHGEEDFVRLELARALQRNIPVVPVLLDGATVPRARDLPDDLKAVTRRNAVAVIIDTFDGQVLRIEREVRSILQAAGVAQLREPVPVLPLAVSPEVSQATTVAQGVVFAGVATDIERTSPHPRPPVWMEATGSDAHGRWADLRVDQVTQRFRLIEPGEFWMGSTEAERKRFGIEGGSDESPRQRVHITQGFWLADTACTQAFWQTVVGENPSHFTGDLRLPVENVSWDDIMKTFLPALNARVNGAEALLPTEAQWEYACRAGNYSAYSFGEQITPDQVNFFGKFLPPGGERMTVRQCTVPVSALWMNAWGLYQMHGNVWEWCADWNGAYAGKIVKDPIGPQDGTIRVVRGGSWIDGAGLCRSATRGARLPDHRDQVLGFRIALRAS